MKFFQFVEIAVVGLAVSLVGCSNHARESAPDSTVQVPAESPKPVPAEHPSTPVAHPPVAHPVPQHAAGGHSPAKVAVDSAPHPVGAGVVVGPPLHPGGIGHVGPLPAPPPPPTPVSGHPDAAAVPADDSISLHEESWFNQLKQGNIEYHVPPEMKWKEASTVTVVIHGYKAGSASVLSEATGSGALKVSDQMRVLLTDPDNPDEFTMTRQPGTDDVQFVPIDGTTIWNWSVVPKYTTKVPQKLLISAWVIYPDGNNVDQELPVYNATVAIHVPGIGDALRRLVEGDPEYWLKYGLPGGGGFVFVAGIVAWWVKRRAGTKGESVKAESSKT